MATKKRKAKKRTHSRRLSKSDILALRKLGGKSVMFYYRAGKLTSQDVKDVLGNDVLL